MSETQTSRVPAGVPTGGQFAATAKSEADVALAEPTASPQTRLLRVSAALRDLTDRNQHHSGNMLPHHSASDCHKCGVDEVVAPLQAYFIDTSLNDEERIEAVEADVVEMTTANDAAHHTGNMLPHQSAGDCRKCHHASALRDITDALEGRKHPWSPW